MSERIRAEGRHPTLRRWTPRGQRVTAVTGRSTDRADIAEAGRGPVGDGVNARPRPQPYVPAIRSRIVAQALPGWYRVVEPLHRIDKADHCIAPFHRGDRCFRPVLAAQMDRRGVRDSNVDAHVAAQHQNREATVDRISSVPTTRKQLR